MDSSNSNRAVPRSARNLKKISAHSSTKIEAPEPNLTHSVICKEGSVEITLPIRTVSEANCFEHWQKKHRRHESQKLQLRLELLPFKKEIKLPCWVKLTRYAPRMLDAFENLPMSFKYIVDGLCEELTGDYRPGRADSDERIVLSCDQVKSKEYGIKIQISF